jgi:hypothetical protein
MKTAKLSKLQKGILKSALSMQWNGNGDFLSSELIGEIFFDIPRLSRFRKKTWHKWDNNRAGYQAEYRLKRRIHNRIDASISRTLTKLQERGLIEKVKGRKTYFTGCRLTAYGLQVAQSLVPAFLTGPSEEERKLMEERATQARIEEEQQWKAFLARVGLATRGR